MHQLNECGPETSRSEVDLQRLLDNGLRLVKHSAANFKKHGFKMNLPLSFGDAFRVLDDLTRPLDVASHLKVLGVLEHGRRHLLRWYFITAALDDFTRFLVLAEMELYAGGYQPNFPLDVVWAALDRVAEECDGLLQLS